MACLRNSTFMTFFKENFMAYSSFGMQILIDWY